jgi:hypothetical protein
VTSLESKYLHAFWCPIGTTHRPVQGGHGAPAIFEDAIPTADLAFTMVLATAAAEEYGLLRLYNGYHFRAAIDAGAELA